MLYAHPSWLVGLIVCSHTVPRPGSLGLLARGAALHPPPNVVDS